MAKYLIVNADDFGISAGVSKGILEAHRDGIVTSTTVMVNMPAAPEAIRLAQQHAPELGLGLHITLSFGAPVSAPEKVPSLVHGDGTFCSTYDELWDNAQTFTPDDLRTEITAQFERFVELAGRLPDHLDSHHHVTFWCPAALDVLLKLAAQHRLPIRNGELIAVDDAVRQVYEANAKPRWPQPTTFEPVFYDDGATVGDLRAFLCSLPEGVTEMMCHPGYAADLDETYAAPREAELKIVTDPGIRALVESEGIRLITFADL
jgi:predicted glycoside hydrolase/deacetylase ChbG (UPF0249 family)